LEARLSNPALSVPLRTFVLSTLSLILALDASMFTRLAATPGVSLYLVRLMWLHARRLMVPRWSAC
jgi:hypothetical protein